MEKCLATIYLLASVVVDWYFIKMMQEQVLVIFIILIQIFMLVFLLSWGKKEKNNIEANTKEKEKYYIENALIATRILFLIINVPLMIVAMLWKINMLVFGVEFVFFLAIYKCERKRETKFFDVNEKGIHVWLIGYAIVGEIVTFMYMLDVLTRGLFGVIEFEFSFAWKIISLNCSLVISEILLERNTKLVSWICKNYKKDPIMTESYNKKNSDRHTMKK